MSLLVHTAPMLAAVTGPTFILALVRVFLLAVLDRLFIAAAEFTVKFRPLPAPRDIDGPDIPAVLHMTFTDKVPTARQCRSRKGAETHTRYNDDGSDQKRFMAIPPLYFFPVFSACTLHRCLIRAIREYEDKVVMYQPELFMNQKHLRRSPYQLYN